MAWCLLYRSAAQVSKYDIHHVPDLSVLSPTDPYDTYMCLRAFSFSSFIHSLQVTIKTNLLAELSPHFARFSPLPSLVIRLHLTSTVSRGSEVHKQGPPHSSLPHCTQQYHLIWREGIASSCSRGLTSSFARIVCMHIRFAQIVLVWYMRMYVQKQYEARIGHVRHSVSGVNDKLCIRTLQ